MADIYWVQNGGSTSANTASAWNTAANGSGSSGIPSTSDNVHIGHADTLAADKGNATCLWDLALTLGAFTTYSGYNTATTTSTLISFTAGQTITHANTNWAELGFRVGMQIVVSGASTGANNDTFDIAAISSNTITTTQSTLQNESAGQSVTVLATIKLAMNANITTTKFTLDTTMRNSTGSNKTITLSGAYPSGTDNRYVLNGENAVIENQDILTYTFNTSANGAGAMKFDDGPYPNMTTAGLSFFNPEYCIPTSTTHGAATFYSMNIGSSSTFQMGSATQTSTLNATKVFEILNTSTFVIGGSVFDAGFSTFAFTMNATDWTIPVTGDTTFGTAPFVCRFYNLILRTPATAGFKALIPNNRTLSVNSLTVEADAVLKGHITAGSGATSTVCSVRRPVIKGSWNFSQLSDGVYVSLMSDTFPITPSDGPVGRVQLSNAGGTFTSDEKLLWTSATSTLLVDGKLTVTGLIDPTGMEFTAVGANPSSANPAKTIWVNSADSNKLYFGSSEVGGGGGSGITALTGDVTASGSGSVAATIANDSVNDDKLANATLAKVDGALPKAGGTMTGEIEATTITLNAVPADPATDDKVRIGESGGSSNMFQIQTNRGNIQIGRNSGAYAHIYTDADQFYFSKPILVDGGGQVFSYNDGLYLGTGTSASGGTTAITVANGSTDITVAGSIAVGGTVDGIDIATDVAANTAKVTNATHTGEVTGATALTIADDVVDEANLKVSNAPVNGYALTAQSAASGGLTWAAMSGGGSALEFGEWRMTAHNPSTSSSNDFNSNTRWVADLADTNYWTQATTSSDHTSIVLHSDGYLTLAANGIYDVWFSTDIFGHGTSAANIDSFVEISTNNSGDRRYATTREVFRINGVNVKYNHQTTAKIRTGGSAVNIYFSAYLNGCGYYLAAYNDYRTSVKVIRLGDA